MTNERSIRFDALGTQNRITAYGSCRVGHALREARNRVLEIHGLMSAYKPGSDVAKLNACAGRQPVKLHDDTFDVIKRALYFSDLTSGAFDCTVRPLTALWGVGKKGDFIPSVRDITEILPNIGYKDLVLDAGQGTAFLRREGMAVDLGGIAKGYAADEVKRIMRGHGIESALINLGGNIVAMGSRPGGSPWRIGIQDPLAPTGEFLAVVPVKGSTVVTSGSNERFFVKDGVRYHHILDPRTGYPAQSGLLSVTVVCESSVDADALTTALFVMGKARGMELIKRIGPGMDAVFVSDDGSVEATEGLVKILENAKGKVS